MERTDEQLVADYIAGEETALDLLIKRYLKPVYGFAFHYVGDDEVAADIAQDVFLKTWKNIKRFDQKRKFKTWIFEIAKNTALDHLKKKKAVTFSKLSPDLGEGIQFEETLTEDLPLPDEILEEKMTRERLEAAIALLPPDYRAVLVLRYHDQLNFQEVAEVLGKPLNTIKSQYRRALVQLRHNLGEAYRNG